MFSIPENKLPDCLKDEQRVNVLFAPLRSCSVNPKDWETKLSSWKLIIKMYCDTNDIYTFSLCQLNNVFIRNGRPPSCLPEVINDMLYQGEIQLVDIFFRENSSSWSGWAVDILVKRPLSWSLNKVKEKMFTTSNIEQNFAYLEVIDLKCKCMLEQVPEKFRNKLISLSQLLLILNKESIHANNIKLLLHHLQNQKKIDITKVNGNDELDSFLIKFGDGSNVSPISEMDIGRYTLEQNEKNLSKNIEILEDDIQDCMKEAKIQLSKNHRQMAKSSLRKKHDLEKRIQKKMDALHNIQTLLQQIHDTHSDAHVWKAYKNALAAFNTSFRDTGISESAIEDTMIKLGDVLDEHNDIQQALSRPTDDDFNDSDLETELAELTKNDSILPPPDEGGMNTSDLAKELENIDLSLPEVPISSPDVSTHELKGEKESEL